MPLSPKKIKSRRESLGLSQTQAARLAGIARPNWARVESGQQTNAKFATVERIADALGCSIDRLRGEVSP